MNCFSVYIDKAKEPYLLVRGLRDGILSCDEWNGTEFEKGVEQPLLSIDPKDISVIHFAGYSEVQYEGLTDFVLGRVFRAPYAKIRVVSAIESTNQYFFNKKKLVAKQRMDILRALLQSQLDGHPISNSVDLMTGLYTLKWVRHPDKGPQRDRVRFYLDSLVDTKELRKEGSKYVLTGEALKAIEVYEEQERRHTANVKMQRGMFWLTVGIVLLTAAQAGVFKLPTLLDLSRWSLCAAPSISTSSRANRGERKW